MAAGVVSSAQQMELYYDRNWLPKPADVSHAFSGPEYGYQNLCLAEIDLNSIIVVHDLASHGSASGVRGEAYNHEDFWLEDLLQRDIPRARIMSFRPIWQVSFEADSTTRGLKARGIELLKSICEDRREDRGERVIIFIVSGMGTLIVKKALLIAQDNDLFESIREQTSILVSVDPIKPAFDLRSREILALNIMGKSIERCTYSMSRTIETLSAAIMEIVEDFSSIPTGYKTVEDELLTGFGVPSEEQFWMERSPLTLRSHSEGIEDRLLTFSDKVRSFAESEPTSRGEWYSDYLSMLSQLHVQQCTYIPISEYPQTLQWLFSHDTYLAWLGTTDPCILHIYGQCGVGKTTLSSFMWKSLHAAGQAQEDDTTTALYFSFDWDDKCRISAKGLLSSMIYQLLKYRPQNFLSIKSHFDWIRRSWPLTVEESWIIFRSLISRSVNGTIICIIDAIDLCDVPLAITLQEMLAFSTSRGIKFKVVATSRIPPDSLHYQLLFCIDLDFQREIRMDMEVSIRVGVCDLLSADATFLEYEDEIVEEFQKRRTHLELILGFEYLKISTLRSTPSCIQDTLQCSGSIQSRLCDHILHKAPTIPPWARIALSWIVHAFRPLTPNELSVAIAIRETTTSYSEIENEVPHHIARDLKHYFGGILSCKHDKIRFIHQSVKDYLLVHLRSPNRSGVALDLTHADLARLCLAYLSLDDFKYNLAWKRVKASSRGCSSPGKFDLLGYAAEYWPRHYQRAEPGEHFSDVVLDFIGNGGFEETRNETRPHKWEPVTYHPRCPLQIAAKLGLADIVTTVLSQHSDNGTTQNDKEAALDMAVESGQLEIAVQLLNDGITSEKALRLAARHGNNEIVEQLLYKSDMEALKTAGTSESDRIPEHDDLSPLHIAALRGHTAVIGTLLEAGFTLKPVNTSGDTPFNLAVKGGQLAALQQLLVVDDTIALADRTHRSLLHLAAREGHLEIVRELVAGGADANAFGTSMSTPLLQAVEGGHEVLVRDLIHDFGADLKAADEVGSCAVHIAAVNGYTRVLEQLCKAEADVKAKDRSGSQPIHLASEKGHLRVTKRLLELGVDPNTVDGRELTPLHLAARGGHLRVVQELLKHPRISLNTFPYTKPKSRTGTGGLDRKSRLENEDYEGPERDNEDALTKDSPKFHADYPAVNAEKVDQNSDEFDYDSTEDESFDESSDGLSASRLLDVNEATPLHSAAVKGYAEIVRELLKAGTRCNICSKLNVTPLHLAAQEGYVSVVKELLNHNADPNIADDNQSSPLHAASITGNLSVVEKLLKFGADVSKADDEQVSPLHHASRHGHVDVVRHLLGAGAELGATNADTQTPLHIAVRQRHCNVVAELLARGANPGTKSGQGWTALHFAVSGECIRTDLIMQIIQGGMDIHASNDNGSTALFLAAESGSEAAVETLLRAGAKADAKNAASSTPMHRAAQEGHVYVVKLLMEAGAHPFAKKRRDITPLQLALGNRHLDVAIQLLEPMKPNLPSVDDYEESLHALARVGFGEGIMKVFKYRLRNLEKKDSKYQQSALSHAAENGHDGVVQMLLAHGADPNSTDKSGRTPLSWAVINRHQAVAEQLLKRGANVRSKDHDQWTALHLAIQDFNLEMVNLLLNAGADVSAPLNGMIMPLHLAAQYDEPRIIQLLVKKGASLSSRDSNQFTPLDHAVRLASVSTVEALLDLGAGHAPPTSDGLTALYWAMDREDDSIVDLLVRRCSDTFVGQQGWKKLHLAALSGNKYSARELLEQGADMDARDQSGLMALHWAAARSHEDVVRILLDMGREIQAKDNEGMTALHHAASRGNERTVMALLKMGAERNVTDLHGWTPLQIAQVYVNDHVCDTLSGEDEATIIPGARSGLAPSRWVKAIDSPATTISEDGLTVIAEELDTSDLYAKLQARADQPMPAGAYTFYFEATVVNAGSKKYVSTHPLSHFFGPFEEGHVNLLDVKSMVAIGFCESNARRVGMPGWHPHSWGYHGDDGKKFAGDGVGVLYGPTYGTGDVVGCGVDFASRTAFFTKNGEQLDTAFTDIKGRLYPMVGISGQETKVTVNFGQNDFLFKDLS